MSFPPINRHEFEREICDNCIANDWYCPTPCEFIEKTRKYKYKRLKNAYIDVGGDLQLLTRRIKRWK